MQRFLLIIKVRWFKIIWLVTILAFRYRLRLSLQRIVSSYGLGYFIPRCPTKNLAPFHNFFKIVSLRSVPHNQAKPTANPLAVKSNQNLSTHLVFVYSHDSTWASLTRALCALKQKEALTTFRLWLLLKPAYGLYILIILNNIWLISTLVFFKTY